MVNLQRHYPLFYGILFVLSCSAAFFLLVLFSRLDFIIKITFGEPSQFGLRALLFIHAWQWSFMDLSLLQQVINALISLLFAGNILSILYFIRTYQASFTSLVSVLSTGGFISALIGLFCISCGSLLLPIISSIFSATFLVLLPFQGLEFSIVSITFLCLSLCLSFKKLSDIRKMNDRAAG